MCLEVTRHSTDHVEQELGKLEQECETKRYFGLWFWFVSVNTDAL